PSCRPRYSNARTTSSILSWLSSIPTSPTIREHRQAPEVRDEPARLGRYGTSQIVSVAERRSSAAGPAWRTGYHGKPSCRPGLLQLVVRHYDRGKADWDTKTLPRPPAAL